MPFPMTSLLPSLRTLLDVGRDVVRLFRTPPTAFDDPQSTELARQAAEARRAGRPDRARALYRQVLDLHRNDLQALRALRDLAADAGDWDDALAMEERVLALVPGVERPRENEWLAAITYELGRVEGARGQAAAAIGRFRTALRADRMFLPAALALGDAHEASGDHREALRAWERAFDIEPSTPLLLRLERAYRREGSPSRMIGLYRAAIDRAPDDLGLAMALGRVYFELEMLDEAADQFEKVELRAPHLAVVHAYLAAVFERRGQVRDAFEEYRRALRLSGTYDWPQRCHACDATVAVWQDRCPQCRRWNTLRSVDGR
ncbi:MAG: tetratricopeptide repeat protein [Candidatus Rokubacteria bacterium]|nr:tetratricopeptide repeat protein [Candidatus Rokubacteria bacterium]